MNFKIENNYLDVTNYPSIERHLANMANKGWLINKIIFGVIFIYKRIEPEKLDFSISPYEIETAFTRKSKEELDEFKSVCESVGWNYATRSFNFHIYFKEEGSEAIDIETDEEEEFSTIEHIAKKQIKGYYFQIPLFLFLSWTTLGLVATNIHSMKDGLAQIAALIVPIGTVLLIYSLFHIKRFLKINRKNIELGKSIEYSDFKYNPYKITFPVAFITIILSVIYILYSAIVFKNKILLIVFLPVLIGGIGGAIYRYFIKPSKKTLNYKKVVFVIIIVVAAIISINIGILNIANMVNNTDKPNVDGYKVLSVKDFTDEDFEEGGDLLRNTSILIPESYEYADFAGKPRYLRTEYSKALTEGLAGNLVNRYKNQAKNVFIGRYSREIELYFKEGIYDDYLLKAGLTKGDLDNLKDKDKKEALKVAKEIINEKSITEDKENLWNADEAYFLNYEKTEIVLRNGKEVFYLDGKDFTDIEIIKIAKEKLGLN